LKYVFFVLTKKMWKLLLVLSFFAPQHAKGTTGYCPAKLCGQIPNVSDAERLHCVEDHIFGPANESPRFVYKSCEGVGWGNSLGSMTLIAELAALLGGRFVISSAQKASHLWNVPRTYHIPPNLQWLQWDLSPDQDGETSVIEWIKNVSTSDSELSYYNNKVLDPNTCGDNPHLAKHGNCLTEALPTYGTCLKHFSSNPGKYYFNLQLINHMPIFYMFFRRPTNAMIKYLNEIRGRLDLPLLQPEPNSPHPHPASWGLYTPGYYILAFHYRNVPLGFEPLSVMLNEGERVGQKHKDLDVFWAKARECAAQAREIAACRNETLLIYLATDDVNLRPAALRELGPYGRVVFGLEEAEVGHGRPQWSEQAEREVDEKRAAVLKSREEQCGGGGEEVCPAADLARKVSGRGRAPRRGSGLDPLRTSRPGPPPRQRFAASGLGRETLRECFRDWPRALPGGVRISLTFEPPDILGTRIWTGETKP
jgi:hypothetical protein